MADYTNPAATDRWWEPNPLAIGTFCTCGQRLERIPGKGKELYPCPLGCEDGGAA